MDFCAKNSLFTESESTKGGQIFLKKVQSKCNSKSNSNLLNTMMLQKDISINDNQSKVEYNSMVQSGSGSDERPNGIKIESNKQSLIDK